MTVPAATREQHEQRQKTMRREIAAFRHALGFFEVKEALHQTRGFRATWHAVRRVATALLGWPAIRDVPTAWGVVYYVSDLPDGKERLKAAAEAALSEWEREAE